MDDLGAQIRVPTPAEQVAKTKSSAPKYPPITGIGWVDPDVNIGDAPVEVVESEAASMPEVMPGIREMDDWRNLVGWDEIRARHELSRGATEEKRESNEDNAVSDESSPPNNMPDKISFTPKPNDVPSVRSLVSEPGGDEERMSESQDDDLDEEIAASIFDWGDEADEIAQSSADAASDPMEWEAQEMPTDPGRPRGVGDGPAGHSAIASEAVSSPPAGDSDGGSAFGGWIDVSDDPALSTDESIQETPDAEVDSHDPERREQEPDQMSWSAGADEQHHSQADKSPPADGSPTYTRRRILPESLRAPLPSPDRRAFPGKPETTSSLTARGKIPELYHKGDKEGAFRLLTAWITQHPDDRAARRLYIEWSKRRAARATSPSHGAYPGAQPSAVPRIDFEALAKTTEPLTPQDGYLLSRIDGHTSIEDLMSMIPETSRGRLDGLLERLWKEGCVRF